MRVVNSAKKKTERRQKLSYYVNQAITCAVCQHRFYREELYSGRGRLIADVLTVELQRTYRPSKQFGQVYPQAYSIVVCPKCLTAVFAADVEKIAAEGATKLMQTESKRQNSLKVIHTDINFQGDRTLEAGLASYILALHSYDDLSNNLIPSAKQGICSLRGAWLANAMHEKYPEENYDYLAQFLYRKACYFYNHAWKMDTERKQPLHEVTFLGPDTDKNYAFSGFMYIRAMLNYYYGQKQNKQKRVEMLSAMRTTVSKMFGLGRSSKGKPSAILNHAHDLHELLAKEIEHLKLSVINA